MTTLMVHVRDDSKVEDLVRFLRDVDFLEVTIASGKVSPQRKPAAELVGTTILGDIVSPVVPESDWDALK